MAWDLTEVQISRAFRLVVHNCITVIAILATPGWFFMDLTIRWVVFPKSYGLLVFEWLFDPCIHISRFTLDQLRELPLVRRPTGLCYIQITLVGHSIEKTFIHRRQPNESSPHVKRRGWPILEADRSAQIIPRGAWRVTSGQISQKPVITRQYCDIEIRNTSNFSILHASIVIHAHNDTL